MTQYLVRSIMRADPPTLTAETPIRRAVAVRKPPPRRCLAMTGG